MTLWAMDLDWFVSLGSLQTLGKTASADGGDGLHRKGQGGRNSKSFCWDHVAQLKGEKHGQNPAPQNSYSLHRCPPKKTQEKQTVTSYQFKTRSKKKNKRHQAFLVGIDSNEFHPALHGMDRKKLVAASCHGGVKAVTWKKLMSLDAGDVASNRMPPPPQKKVVLFFLERIIKVVLFFGGKQKEF